MIIEKNINKYNRQYATTELRQRTNEHLDSIIMHTFMRLSHLKKNADGFKSLYLHMGHFTIVYGIWVWIPIKQRNHHWFSSKDLKAAILKYLGFDMAICNITKYLDDLCRLGLMELKYKGRSYRYRVKPLQTK